jgi:hypothetical protein
MNFYRKAIQMLDFDSKLPAKPLPDQPPRVPPVPAHAKSAVKTGTIVLLTPTALKLSRDLQAIQSDPDKEPAARMEANESLRKLAAQVFNGD